MPAKHAIYFAPGGYYSPVLNPKVYKFDYAEDGMTDTGLTVAGNVAGGVQYNVGIRDGANPYVAYVFLAPTQADAPLRLCKATLTP